MSVRKLLRTSQSFFPRLRDMKASVQRRLVAARPTLYDEAFDVLRFFPAGSATILDVGANQGVTIAGFAAYPATRRIIGFEPNPVLAAKLARRFRPDERIVIEPRGLGDGASSGKLFIPTYRGYEYDGLGSLHEAAARDWISAERMYLFDPSRLRVTAYDVDVVGLDSLDLGRVDLIKLQIQGHEHAALLGARRTIARDWPLILIAYAQIHAEARRLLAELGYTEQQLNRGSLEPWQGRNLFCIFVPPQGSARWAGLAADRGGAA
ncbi:MAG: FkbM family methyltransferase [Acetobacteraceae bacterium]|nr:FkbM family methyltransferase [Acetobacteraceae bacterium]